jgi:hypothetical protein
MGFRVGPTMGGERKRAAMSNDEIPEADADREDLMHLLGTSAAQTVQALRLRRRWSSCWLRKESSRRRKSPIKCVEAKGLQITWPILSLEWLTEKITTNQQTATTIAVRVVSVKWWKSSARRHPA